MATPPCKTPRTLPAGPVRNSKRPWRCKGRHNRLVVRKARNCLPPNRLGSHLKLERKNPHTSGSAHRAWQSPALPWPKIALPDLGRLHLQTPWQRWPPPRWHHLAACCWRCPFRRASLTAMGRCLLETFGRRLPPSTPTPKRHDSCWLERPTSRRSTKRKLRKHMAAHRRTHKRASAWMNGNFATATRRDA